MILVVEEEMLLRFMTAGSLRNAGYCVVEVRTAEEARAVFDAGTSVDLVFSEIHLPGAMNGLDLSRWLSERHPGVPLVLTGGYSDAAAAKNVPAAFLSKPYHMADVVLCIESLLKHQSKGTASYSRAVRQVPPQVPETIAPVSGHHHLRTHLHARPEE